jgi:hypothetical protein
MFGVISCGDVGTTLGKLLAVFVYAADDILAEAFPFDVVEWGHCEIVVILLFWADRSLNKSDAVGCKIRFECHQEIRGQSLA